MLTIVHLAILLPILAAAVGGQVYYLLAAVASRKLRRTRAAAATPHSLNSLPMSLLKPLHGADAGLEVCLEKFFLQEYPSYEILFAVRNPDDPAIAVVGRLTARYPHIPVQIIYTGEPPYANAKVYSMEKMSEAAKFETLVITDSDTSVSADYLKHIARAFEPPEVGAVTNLYRGVGGADLWSRLEALGMSTEFMAGVVMANQIEGMKFTLGPSMAIRKECLNAIGGFAKMADYLADDFVIGQWSAAAGYRVALSTHVIDHHATALGFKGSMMHRLRWNRSSRFSRPAGYIGQGFTYGLPWTMVLCAVVPFWWSAWLLPAALAVRLCLAYELAVGLLEDKRAVRDFALIPLQDLLSFATWLSGFLGREVVWRNERYTLLEGGRFAPLAPRRTD